MSVLSSVLAESCKYVCAQAYGLALQICSWQLKLEKLLELELLQAARRR